MKKMTYFSIIVLILLGFVLDKNVLSWDNNITHKDLSEFAVKKSILNQVNGNYLMNLGFNGGLNQKFKWNQDEKTTTEWIQDGGYYEDEPLSRSFNHFHNPLRLWSQAGLDDWVVFHLTGKSSLLWAQDGFYQQSSVNENWSWQKTREHFYIALTSTNDSLRQENFAKTFRGLGHQMHLLQDTAVPDHVRNDAHPEDAIFGKVNINKYFESWAKSEQQRIIDLASNPNLFISPAVSFNVSYNSLAPTTQLFDAEQYNGTNPSTTFTQGLSEYTNANFFSEGTIFAAERYSADNGHYFPYPKKSSTDLQNYLAGTKPEETVTAEDGDTDTGIWIIKNADGENVSHFVRTGKLTKWYYNILGEGELFYKTFYRDDICHADYAQKLIPRAVGYSAGLLNYFFRGTLEISAPDQYVYSIIDGSKTPQQFTHIKAKVMNATPGESIQNGTIQAVARYKVIPDYSPDLSSYPPNSELMKTINYSYAVSEAITLTPEQRAFLNAQPTEFAFDFSAYNIPAGITDLTLQVIFKGTLGNETDIAVAIGMKDLHEPTHHVFWNLTDMFSLDGHLYTADQIRSDPTLLSLADGVYIDPYPISLEISYMPESPPLNPVHTSARAENLSPGKHIRLIVLADNELTDNYARLSWTDAIDPEAGIYDFAFSGVTNQEENGTWLPPTPVDIFRTLRQHLHTGVLKCKPMFADPISGAHYCPYPESEAIIPSDLTPYPAELLF